MDNVVFGNLCGDPILRQPRRGGRPTARFTVAVNVWRRTEREFVERPSVFHRIVCFGQLAENVTNSLRKGMEVLAVGEWVDDSYSDEQGQRRVQVAMEARAIGPTLRRATAQVHKTERRIDTEVPTVDLDTGQPADGTGPNMAASTGRPAAATVQKTAAPGGRAGSVSKIAASFGRAAGDSGSGITGLRDRDTAMIGQPDPGSNAVTAPIRAFDSPGLDIPGSDGRPAEPAVSIGRVPDGVDSAPAVSSGRASGGSKIAATGSRAVGGSASALRGSGDPGGAGQPAEFAESGSQVPDGSGRPSDSANSTITTATSRSPDNPTPEIISPTGTPRDDVIADLRAAGVIGPASAARGRRGTHRRKEAESDATAARAG